MHGTDRARFTALTDRVWRLQWSADGAWDDAPTLPTLTMQPAVGACRVRRDGAAWVIGNDAVELRWIDDGQPFSAANLTASFACAGTRGAWRPGDAPTGNLRGPRRTLDSFHGDALFSKERNELVPQPDELGLLSRDGWAQVDLSDEPRLDALTDGRLWPRAARAGQQDWLLFLHGRDYAGALADAARVFGRMAPPPRWALGLWISRWWAYSDEELLALLREYAAHDAHPDVVVLDMEWHRDGWCGTDWEPALFPDPAGFLRALRALGCRTTLNLHPAGGVRRDESTFAAMAEQTATPADAERVAFDCTSPTYMAGYFRHLLHPHEDLGVDFWWLDWQQGTQSAIAGLDPLPWLNHLHADDQRARGRRPMLFTRYGGLGSGRHPIGFSGDTESSWRTLRHLVRFTADSAHALYGQWSHDVGGFFESPWEGRLTPELYLRWVQLAVHHPILRTHCARVPHGDRRFWLWGEPHGALMLAAVRRRRELAAVLHAANRRAHDTAIAAVHGCWIEHPEHDAAYAHRDQYRLGDDLLVAPVLGVVGDDGRAAVTAWLPPGRWLDTAHGDVLAGDQVVERRYALDEVPVFQRAGSAVPVHVGAARLSDPACLDTVGFEIAPGADGTGAWYDDDGVSDAWRAGHEAWWRLHVAHHGATTRLHLDPIAGAWPGMPRTRRVVFRLLSALPPAAVQHAGRDVAWTFNHQRQAIEIAIDAHAVDAALALDVTWRIAPGTLPLGAVIGHCRQAFHALRACVHPAFRPAAQLAHTAQRIARHPERLAAELAALREGLPALAVRLEHDAAVLDVSAKRGEAQREALRRSQTWISAAVALIRQHP